MGVDTDDAIDRLLTDESFTKISTSNRNDNRNDNRSGFTHESVALLYYYF